MTIGVSRLENNLQEKTAFQQRSKKAAGSTAKCCSRKAAANLG